MNKCPFIAVRQLTREIRVDADGKVVEQRETPAVELRECLGAECEIFDAAAGRCALPTIEIKIQRLEELQRAVQEDASHALVGEVRETRENMAATLIHVLRKADAANELLGQIAERAKQQAGGPGGGAGDVSALLAPLIEMKEALAISQTKFSDILELMLEDQQKRAMEAHAASSGGAVTSGPVTVDLGPVSASLTEMKDALGTSNAKFSDILELMLEEQQKRALEAHAATAAGAVAAGPASIDLGPVSASLTEMKDALNTSNAKFTDILELMLEEQQKRASPGAVVAPAATVDLAPLQAGLAGMKDALDLSQAKFSDILELMLEEQQRKAAEGAAVATALDKLAEKQAQLFGTLAQQLQPAAGGQDWQRELKTELTSMAGMIEQGILRLADAENKRQAELDGSARRITELQQTMLTLLESQRSEQNASAADRRRQQAEEHNEKGVMLYHRREPGAAEAEFRRAIDIRPDFAEAHNNLGLALSDQGKRDEAVTVFKKAIELLPDAPEAYNNLGCLFKIKKDYQQAVEYFNQAIAKRADYSPGYFNLGLAYEEMEKFDPAIRAWEKVLTLQPTHDEARRKIATYRARKA
jgi:tetratricopeptide (TPR) repeat protein